MDMAKRILTFVLVGLMVFLSVPFVQAEGAGNYKIDWLVEKNYVQGRDGGKLDLEKTITRAEFTKMVLVATGELEFAQAFSAGGIFIDVPADHWAAAIINYASQKGYIKGHLDGTFKPDDNITFEEAITILTRLNKEFVEPDHASEYWAQPYIDFANQVGILADVNISSYKDDVVRQHAFEMVYNEIEVKESFARAEEAKKEADKKAEEAKKEADKKAEEAKKEADKKDQEKKNDQAKKDRDDDYYNPPYWPGNDYWDGPTYDPEVNPSPTPTPEPGPSPEPGPTPQPPTPTPESDKYKITIAEGIKNGSVSANVAEAKEGDTVTLTVTPDTNYEVDKVTVTDAVATKSAENVYTFTMPGNDVSVTATFKAKTPEQPEDPQAEAKQAAIQAINELLNEANSLEKKENYQKVEGELKGGLDQAVQAAEDKIADKNATLAELTEAKDKLQEATDNIKAELAKIDKAEADKKAEKEQKAQEAAEEAVAALEKAVKDGAEITDDEITAAEGKIDQVTDPEKKADFENRLKAVKEAKAAADKKKADEAAEAARQAAADEAVKALEEKDIEKVTETEISDAQGKINQVTDNTEKQKLQTRLNTVITKKQAADEKKTEDEKKQAVVDAINTLIEESKSLKNDDYYNDAGKAKTAYENAVNDANEKIANKESVTLDELNTAKAGLKTAIDDLKTELARLKKADDDKKAEEAAEAERQAAADEALKKLEAKNGDVSDQEIADAKDLIDKVTNDAEKQKLQARLDEVKAAKAEADKKKAEEARQKQDVIDAINNLLADEETLKADSAYEKAGQAKTDYENAVTEARNKIANKETATLDELNAVKSTLEEAKNKLNTELERVKQEEAANKVTEIRVNSLDHKTKYKVCDDLSVENLTIEVTRVNGNKEIVPVTKEMVKGFNSASEVVSQTLTIKYAEQETTYTVEIESLAKGKTREALKNKFEALKASQDIDTSKTFNFSVAGNVTQEDFEKILAEELKTFEGSYLNAVIVGHRYQIGHKSTGSPGGPYEVVETTIDLDLNFTHTAAQETEINEYIDGVISELALSAKSEYKKVLAVHDYIITHAAYFLENGNNNNVATVQLENGQQYYTVNGVSVHSPYAITKHGQGVCQAYAGLFQKFMERLNIESYYVTGRVKGQGETGESAGDGHAWNKVKIGEKYYNIDLTWDDGLTDNRQQPAVSGNEDYEFFLKSDAFFEDSRIIDTVKDEKLKANVNYKGAPTGRLNNNQGSNSYEESDEFYNFYEEDLDYRPAA